LLHHIFFQTTTSGQHFYVFIHLLSQKIRIMRSKSEMLVKMLANMLVPIANRTVAHLTTTITKFCNKIKKIHNKIKSSQQH